MKTPQSMIDSFRDPVTNIYDFSTRIIDKYGCVDLPDGWVLARFYYPTLSKYPQVLALIKNERCVVFFRKKEL